MLGHYGILAVDYYYKTNEVKSLLVSCLESVKSLYV